MKRILLYSIMVVLFLGLIFAFDGVYNTMQNNDKNSNAQSDTASHSPDEFHSNLPLVIIDTDNQRITKDEKIVVQISLIDGNDNSLSDTPTLVSYAQINYRGSSSYIYEKKQYRIEFKADKDKNRNIDYPVFGMPPASDWVLNGPFLDRSLMRNYIGYSVSNELLHWAPNTEYCEVFVDGEYMGLYIMIEAITNEDGRLNLSDFSLLSGRTSYVLRIDRVGTGDNPILTYGILNGKMRNEISIDYPAYSNITPSQQEYIINDVNTFEEALYSDYFADPNIGYAKYIDVDSFVDYFIINEFMMMIDAGNLSTYVYKGLDSKCYITTWDFNNSYDNLPWDVKAFDEFYLVNANWFNRLVEDRQFVDKVIERYYHLRETTLSDETLHNIIDENYEYIYDAATRNFEVWGYTFNYNLLKKDDGVTRDPQSFDEAVDMLKSAIAKRGAFLDDNIDDLYVYCIN